MYDAVAEINKGYCCRREHCGLRIMQLPGGAWRHLDLVGGLSAGCRAASFDGHGWNDDLPRDVYVLAPLSQGRVDP